MNWIPDWNNAEELAQHIVRHVVRYNPERGLHRCSRRTISLLNRTGSRLARASAFVTVTGSVRVTLVDVDGWVWKRTFIME